MFGVSARGLFRNLEVRDGRVCKGGPSLSIKFSYCSNKNATILCTFFDEYSIMGA